MNLRSKAGNAKANREAKEAAAKLNAGLAQTMGGIDPNNCSASDSKRSEETMDADDLDAFWSLVRLVLSCHEAENKDILPKPKEKATKK